jgi:hypothetical protein
MSQTRDPSAWCAALQAKLMAALDAAWALIEASPDPAAIAHARGKARACGQLAADARKIARMVPAAGPAKTRREPILSDDMLERLEAAATRALVPEVAEEEPTAKPPAAQAVAMRAALRKLGRKGR